MLNSVFLNRVGKLPFVLCQKADFFFLYLCLTAARGLSIVANATHLFLYCFQSIVFYVSRQPDLICECFIILSRNYVNGGKRCKVSVCPSCSCDVMGRGVFFLRRGGSLKGLPRSRGAGL